MLSRDDRTMVGEPLLLDDDEPADPRALPDVRFNLLFRPDDDDLGLRALVENPEGLSPALWADGAERRTRGRRRKAKRARSWDRAA